METVYKYPIQITDSQKITLPCGHQFLYVGRDPNGVACIWARVDTDRSQAPVEIYVVGTGNPMPPLAGRHIGTFVEGAFVWHLFLRA